MPSDDLAVTIAELRALLGVVWHDPHLGSPDYRKRVQLSQEAAYEIARRSPALLDALEEQARRLVVTHSALTQAAVAFASIQDEEDGSMISPARLTVSHALDQLNAPLPTGGAGEGA